MRTGKKPIFKGYFPFGAPAWAWRPRKVKSDAKSIPGIYVGRHPATKSHQIYVKTTTGRQLKLASYHITIDTAVPVGAYQLKPPIDDLELSSTEPCITPENIHDETDLPDSTLDEEEQQVFNTQTKQTTYYCKQQAMRSPYKHLFTNSEDEEIGYFIRNKILIPIKRRDIRRHEHIHKTTALWYPKFDETGTAYKGKLRLVFSSSHQVRGIHYTLKSSHAPKWTSLLIHIGIQPDEPTTCITQLADIKKAYIQATNKTPTGQRIIVTLPRDLQQHDDKGLPYYYILTKPLYGKVDAGLLWQQTLFEFLESIGYKASTLEPTLFVKNKLRIIIWTDDILIRGPELDSQEFIVDLDKRFPGITHNKSTWFLGHELRRLPNGTHTLSCHRKIDEALQRFDLVQANKKDTPMAINTNNTTLTSTQSPLADITQYQQLQGTLTYIATTSRPDIAYAVSQTGQAASQPTQAHAKAQKRILQYLNKTKDYQIRFHEQPQHMANIVTAYTDASFQCNSKLRSQTGWIIFMNNGPIAWNSSTQKTIACSTQEAEILAAHDCTKMIIYIRNVLEDIGYKQTNPTIIYCDNTAAIEFYESGLKTKRNMHIQRDVHFQQQEIANGTIIPKYINTADNIADQLTKALAKSRHQQHTDRIIDTGTTER
jgi:hypothetical protein